MGILSWFTDLFKESPPEPLVFGAELRCQFGSQDSFLMLETDNIDINNLPRACVDDCVAFTNIQPFGECYGGPLCEFKMELEDEWENPEPQNELINGKEIITTKSVLICKAKGMMIHAVTSGQEKTFAKQMALFMEMEKKYPGLYDILMNPNASLYLNEGMYKKAIDFLEDIMTQNGGEILLPTIYDRNNPEGDMIRLALEKLLPDCDTSAFDHFMSGLENTGVLNNMDEVEGWDVHYLNQAMIEMLRKDCAATDEKIKTDPFARWTEEHKIFTSTLADTVTQLANAAVMYRAMQAKPVEGSAENPLGKIKEKVKNGKNTERPTWRQSEEDAKQYFSKRDFKPQQSFKNGEPAKYGTKGSVRPDFYKEGTSVDVKNYNVESAQGRNNLIRNIQKQYYQRVENLPPGTQQKVMIDIRGQNISHADLKALSKDIMSSTENGIEVMFKKR